MKKELIIGTMTFVLAIALIYMPTGYAQNLTTNASNMMGNASANARMISGSTPLFEQRARHADPGAADVAGERGRVIGHRLAGARRVGGIRPGQHAEGQRRVVGGARQRADLVQ